MIANKQLLPSNTGRYSPNRQPIQMTTFAIKSQFKTPTVIRTSRLITPNKIKLRTEAAQTNQIPQYKAILNESKFKDMQKRINRKTDEEYVKATSPMRLPQVSVVPQTTTLRFDQVIKRYAKDQKQKSENVE